MNSCVIVMVLHYTYFNLGHEFYKSLACYSVIDRRVRFQPGPGSSFRAGAGVPILAVDFWSRFGGESDLLKL